MNRTSLTRWRERQVRHFARVGRFELTSQVNRMAAKAQAWRAVPRSGTPTVMGRRDQKVVG
jgi:hypothetical protein